MFLLRTVWKVDQELMALAFRQVGNLGLTGVK